MSGWNSTFRVVADGGCDPRKWKPYFVHFDPSLWEATDGGALEYFADSDLNYSLVISYWDGLGFLLRWCARSPDLMRTESCKYSLGDPDALDRFEEQDDLTFPAGCFVPPSTAWLAVEDFLHDPLRPSHRIEWVDTEDISWPEM